MSLYAIGDTHLSLGTDKPMDIFHGWDNYFERLESNWKKLITDEDTVVILGDVSWAMKLENAAEDLAFINSLPGQKLILKGNHDYWWNTMSKMNGFLEENSFSTIKFIFNNAYRVGDYSICGTRGWFFDDTQQHSEKVVKREAARLEASVKAGKELGGEPLVFLHYPPVSISQICEPIYDVLLREGIKHCYYAHLHGQAVNFAFTSEKDGIKFELLSADYLKFCPKLIKLTK